MIDRDNNGNPGPLQRAYDAMDVSAILSIQATAPGMSATLLRAGAALREFRDLALSRFPSR